MANETPRFTSRSPYVFACLFGLTLFFLDITYQTFDPLDRIKISSKNFLQTGLNNLKNSFESVQINFSEKKLLINENKNLKEELSILSVITQLDIFNSKLDDVSHPHRIISFDTDQYFCCSNHRMFVEKNEKLIKEMINQKILVVKAGQNVIRMLPPLILEKKHVDEAIKKTTKAFEKVNEEN